MKIIILFIYVVIINISILQAQITVTGTVTNQSDKPLSEVNVKVKDFDIECLTNDSGKYKLELPAKAKFLIFKKNGYIIRKVEIKELVCNIKLNSEEPDYFDLSMQDLLKIKVITASKIDQTINKAPSIVTVITRSEIKAMGARDLTDIFRTIPGIEIGIRTELGYQEIAFRGIVTPNTEKVKFLIDDVPVNEHLEGSGTIVFADMPVENIERIEIIRGPGSALYGTNAFVGVINIITQKGNNNTSFGQIQIGSFNSKKAALIINKKIKELYLNTYIGYLYTDGDKQKIESDVLSTNPLNKNISLAGTDKGVTNFKNEKISAGINLEYNRLYFRCYYTNSYKGSSISPSGAVVENSKPHPLQYNSIIGYNYLFNNNLNISTQLYYTYYKANNLWEINPPGYIFAPENAPSVTYPLGQFQINGATQSSVGGNIKLEYKTKTNSLIWGIGYDNISLFDVFNKSNDANPLLDKDHLVEFPSIMKQEPNRIVISSYIQDQWQITENIALTAGIRWDNYNDAGNTLNPRGALVWTPSKIYFKFMYGRAFRAPTFVESYLFAMNGFVKGNKDNTPEIINSYETEVGYQLSKNLNIRINYYYNSIDKLINLIPVVEKEIVTNLEYNNTNATTHVQGVEAELKFIIQSKISGFINYSFHNGTIKNKELSTEIIGLSPSIINIGINIILGKYININSVFTFAGSRTQAATDTRSELKGYNYGTLNVIGKNFIENFEITMGIYNFLNSDIRYFDMNGFLKKHYPQESRSILLGVRYKF